MYSVESAKLFFTQPLVEIRPDPFLSLRNAYTLEEITDHLGTQITRLRFENVHVVPGVTLHHLFERIANRIRYMLEIWSRNQGITPASRPQSHLLKFS